MGSSRVVLVIASLLLIATPALAGDLVPPPTVTPTGPNVILPGKITTLPYTITTSGTWVLEGNIAAASYAGGPGGIVIAASSVTLDLNGFAVDGQGKGGDGIGVAAGATGVLIRNGTVLGWAGNGINAGAASGNIFENLRTNANGSSGLMPGTGAVITDCAAASNGVDGILAQSACTLTQCTCRNNGAVGISIAQTCTMSGCTAMTNMSDGIRLGSLCNVSDCTAGGNSGNGFASSEIGGTGPAVGASIIHCTATANGNPGGGSGFTNYNGCLITGCMANLNWNHGIVVGSHCFVVQNSCDRNGDPTVPLSGVGSGVYLLGGLNRIEGNNLTQNANYGVEIPAASGVSVVIRNAASSNLFGPYLPVGLAGQAAGPVIGAAGMATDTNPNSNLAN